MFTINVDTIKKLRKSKNLSQKELGTLLGFKNVREATMFPRDINRVLP